MNKKIALITGGSSGIGRATAFAFANKNIIVVIASRGKKRGSKTVQEITQNEGKAHFIQTDVSDSDSIKNLITKIIQDHGRIDYAVNNAASAEGSFKPTAEFEEDEFDRVMETNVKGLWLCMKNQIQQMLQQDSGGAIVNVSSVNGLGGAPGGAIYSASKSAVLALTKSAAQEYAQENIRVNALVPGTIKTPMFDGVIKTLSESEGISQQKVKEQYTNMIPLHRLGSPQEAANAIVWLCSEEASYITGHSMIVDGGLTSPFR